jgi:dephospho-CoA kinase
MTPTTIGLTGGVSAGKSATLEALGRLGAETVSSDALVHELLATDELRGALVERWGTGIAPNGELDRGRIAEIVFRDRDELAWLEAQLHPRVGRRIAEWRAALAPSVELAVVEVPLLFEAGMEDAFDATLAVTAPLELRAERAEGRGLGELEGRDGRQLADEEKAARSDFVVANDGTLADLEAKLEALLPELKSAGR